MTDNFALQGLVSSGCSLNESTTLLRFGSFSQPEINVRFFNWVHAFFATK